MCKNRTIHSTLIYKIHCLACKVVQSVQIHRLLTDCDLLCRLLHFHNCLEHDSASILNELSHRVKICCKVYRCREDSFLILAFTLSEELFPPLRYIMQAWLIICHDLNRFSLTEQNVTCCCIEHCVIFLKWILKCEFSSFCCTFHQLVNISSADCDREKSNSCQYRETSSNIIRYYELFVSFLISKSFQSSTSFVCCCIDSLSSLSFAILLLQHLLENTECNCRLCCCSGFGNDIN